MAKRKPVKVVVYSEYGEFQSYGEIVDWVMAYDWDYYPPQLTKIPKIRLETSINGRKDMYGFDFHEASQKDNWLETLLNKIRYKEGPGED